MKMDKNAKLAIIIPAYKPDFFSRVLDSLAAQTDKRFTVYVGIDGVDADFEAIVAPYTSDINIVVHRFADNMGGHNLVGQWHRCIDLIDDEAWIMMFSDDDMLEPECVEAFYKRLEHDGDRFDLYHFELEIIDASDRKIKSTPAFPPIINGLEVMKLKNTAKIESAVGNYIFRRSSFEKAGGFVNLDLAWGSDTATWALLGKNKGIATIDGPKVLWRSSDVNITPTIDKKMMQRKLKIYGDYINWCRNEFDEYGDALALYHMFRQIVNHSQFLSLSDAKDAIVSFFDAEPRTSGSTLLKHLIFATYWTYSPMRKMLHFFKD